MFFVFLIRAIHTLNTMCMNMRRLHASQMGIVRWARLALRRRRRRRPENNKEKRATGGRRRARASVYREVG